ncbi:MAG: hypothetical protein LBR34_09640, partial [Prevotella sp.]|nr:hypothetical protein [Prevotella sp.]
RYRGFEIWSSAESGLYDCKGNKIATSKPSPTNFRIYWDGDLQDELLDGTTISKWNTSTSKTSNLLSPSGLSSCNSTKKTPNISADILGDWREEVIWYETANPSRIRIYTTTTATTNRLYTLMHDPVYRLGIAWQNVAYNQPPHLGFYIGDGLENIPVPNIYTPRYGDTNSGIAARENAIGATVHAGGGELRITSSGETVREVYVYSVDGRLLHRNSHVNGAGYTCALPSNNKLLLVKVITSTGVQSLKIAVNR